VTPERRAQVEALKDLVLRVFLSLGNGIPGSVVEEEEDEEAGQVTLTWPRLGQFIVVGVPVEKPSILGPKFVPGYEVGFIEVSNNYPREPDDAEPVTYSTQESMPDAVVDFAALFVRAIVRNITSG
jgi:hypothetical protein